MSDSSLRNKDPKLTAGRYKLLIPVHPRRGASPLPKQTTSLSGTGGGLSSPTIESPQMSQPVQATGKKRLTLDPIRNKHVKLEIDIVQQYLNEMGIPTVMRDLTTELLQNNILPYNPYPAYIRKFRRLSERFHIRKRSLTEIKRKLDVPIVNLRNSVLAGVNLPAVNIWGLEHIVGHINPATVQSYHDLASSTVTTEQASAKTNQQVSVLTSVYGPAIFNNSFYKDLVKVDLKVSVIVTSPDMKKAARTFALVLIEDLQKVFVDDSRFLLDLQIPVEKKGGWQNHVFSRSDLTELFSSQAPQTNGIENMIAKAVIAKKRIYLNLLSLKSSNLGPARYIFVTKLYDLLLLQTSIGSPNDGQGRRVQANLPPRLVPSTLPFQALLEGVFLDRSQADLYFSTFQQFYSPAQNPAGNTRAPSKLEPMHPQVLNTVTEAWQMKIASQSLEHSAFPTLHYMLLLHLTQKRTKTFSNHSEDDVAIQICRFHEGTALKLNNLLAIHSAVQKLQTSAADEQTDLITNVMMWYSSQLFDIFQTDYCAMSSDMKTLEEYTQRILEKQNEKPPLKDLQQLSFSISLVSLGYVEDALEHCPAILNFKARMNALFPHLVPRPPPVEKISRRQHGVKMQGWTNIDNMKVDKLLNISNSQAPKAIAPYYTAMQYCSDMRLDLILREFLQHLLLKENYLPPNPHPIFVSFLRKASMSVQVLFESDAAVANRVLQKKIIAVGGVSDVFNVSGTSAFGQRSALILHNLLGFRQASELATQILMAPPGDTVTGLPMIRGPFQVIVCSGLTAPSVYFGSISPYLSSLDIDEHFYIKGPPNQINLGSTSLAQLVLSHLESLIPRGVVLHQVKFGNVTLNLRHLVATPARFESEYTAAVSGKQIITCSFFYPLSWRYIQITKRMLVYFADSGSDRVSRMFPHTSSTDRRGVSIFLHPDDAGYSLRSSRILTPSLKTAVEDAWLSRDWPRLIKQTTRHIQATFGDSAKKTLATTSNTNEEVSKSLLAFSYRYHNATPGQPSVVRIDSDRHQCVVEVTPSWLAKHNMLAEMDYLISLNHVLQSLFEQATSTLKETANLASVLNLSLVEQMIEEYMVKLNELVSRGSTLAPATASSLLLDKLRTVAFSDRNNRSLHVMYDDQSIEILREVNGYVMALRNSSAEDLITALPSVRAHLDGL